VSWRILTDNGKVLGNGDGTVTFAGATYRAGRRWARPPIDVTIVAGSVQLSRDGKVIRVHPIRHDRPRELGAFANPKGRPRRLGPRRSRAPRNRRSDLASWVVGRACKII
jgi:hypothetical protein